MKVVVLGSCSWDTIYDVGTMKQFSEDISLWANNIHHTVGSTGAGKALCLDALGAQVTLVTSLGSDDLSNNILDYFKSTNISLINLAVDKAIAHTNIMHSEGSRISVTTSSPTYEPIHNNNVESIIQESDLVYLNINNFARGYIPYIKKHRKLCIVDIHDYDPPNPYHQEFIAAADILVTSGVHIKNHQEFLDEQVREGKKLVVITLGSKGMIAQTQSNEIIKLPGYNELPYMDSNGAGDSFCSGLGYSLLQNESYLEALKYGTICGGISCSSRELYPKNMGPNVVSKYRLQYFNS